VRRHAGTSQSRRRCWRVIGSQPGYSRRISKTLATSSAGIRYGTGSPYGIARTSPPLLSSMVGRPGLEPGTLGLKVPCSTR
jgi:hypothetical protein